MTTWVLHFGPSVPDSSSGLPKYTHRESTYSRAFTLSRALTITLSDPQNLSLKTSSVAGDTRFCRALAFMAGLITAAARAAAVDLALHRHKSVSDLSMLDSAANVTKEGAWAAR